MTQPRPDEPLQPIGSKRRNEPTWSEAMAYPLACVGAMFGAALGAGVSILAARAGFYAIILVGILTGFGAVLLSRRGGWPIAAIALLIAIAASLWTEWWLFPFVADDSLRYFVQHIADLPPFRLLMHAIGAAAAGYIAFRR